MAIAGTTDASPYYQDSSAGTITLAPKKKKGEKRPRDDLPVSVGSEAAPVEAEIPSQEETAEPSSKKRKEGNQQPQAAGIVRPRETDVTNPVHRSESAGEPALNLASLDDLEDASPEVTLRKKKKSKKTGDREMVASALVSSTPGTSVVSASSRKKTLRVEFPDHVSFEYDGPTPLIYAPYKCAELVSQIKCGPKPLPSVSDLIFKDEYVDAARTKLLGDGSMNFVVEKYDTALKKTREALRKSEKAVAATGKLLRRKKAEWRDEFVRMAEKRERAIARKKIQRERADAAEAELSIANVTIATLESRKASLMEEMGVKAEEHKKELGRLRDSRVYGVTKERMRVETEMIVKSNRHFGNLREWWTRRGPFDTARLLQSQAFGTKRCLEALKAGGRDIPQDVIDTFAAREKQFEEKASKLDPGEIPEIDLILSPLHLDSQFVDRRTFVGLDTYGSNAELVDPRTAPRSLHLIPQGKDRRKPMRRPSLLMLLMRERSPSGRMSLRSPTLLFRTQRVIRVKGRIKMMAVRRLIRSIVERRLVPKLTLPKVSRRFMKARRRLVLRASMRSGRCVLILRSRPLVVEPLRRSGLKTPRSNFVALFLLSLHGTLALDVFPCPFC
ncbi:hypothetical protein Bca52824_081719 [Brassica carinata]|uniref:Uncharacterized protein n=1 Tax=Brassica carinata TaxID=52824 RepID=A0A8X7PIZ1_BRACI|nr:hypothetical protein Bca52824_081719 [Brassica carinata]